MTSRPILLRGGRVVTADGERESDLLIEGEQIRGVEQPGTFAAIADAEVIDVSGMLVCPGLIDIHVHLREPGFEWKETIESGARAAASGGFTAMCAMPNTQPVNDCAAVTEFILRQAARSGLSRVFPIGAITKGSAGDEIAPMVELREAGCVAFSDDGVPVTDAGMMRRALEYSRLVGATLSCHEEDLSLSDGFAMNEGSVSLRLGLKGMPAAAENVMISRDIELAHLTGARVHFCHVSTARGALLIRRAKEDGLPVTAEVTPHHLTLTEDAVGRYDTNAKMNPPLRTAADVEALIEALADGVIDCIASDHAPHEADAKQVEFAAAPNGIIGLQTNLPLTLALVRAGRLSLRRAIGAWTECPARCFGLPAPMLKAGAVADLVVIDPERRRRLTPDLICSKSLNSPFLGAELQGFAVRTFVGGRSVYDGV